MLLVSRFGPQADVYDSLPMFPDVAGGHVSSYNIAKVVDALAEKINEPTVDPDGDIIFGNHSWRTGGSVYFTSIGLDPCNINLLATWRSSLITHYSKLAPLKALTSEFKRVAHEKFTKSPGSDASHNIKLVDAAMEANMFKVIEAQMREYGNKFKELQDMFTMFAKVSSKKYVINRTTRVTHRIQQAMKM